MSAIPPLSGAGIERTLPPSMAGRRWLSTAKPSWFDTPLRDRAHSFSCLSGPCLALSGKTHP
jgi:hypothetical protein